MGSPSANSEHHAVGVEVATDNLPHQRFAPRVEQVFELRAVATLRY